MAWPSSARRLATVTMIRSVPPPAREWRKKAQCGRRLLPVVVRLISVPDQHVSGDFLEEPNDVPVEVFSPLSRGSPAKRGAAARKDLPRQVPNAVVGDIRAGKPVDGRQRIQLCTGLAAACGAHKILEECSLPLTAMQCVDMIVTDLCVFEVREGGLHLTELAPGVTVDEIREKTGASFSSGDVRTISL